MPQYAAVVGNHPFLSVAELAAVVPGFTLIPTKESHIVLFESTQTLDSTFIDMLGGTLFLAEKTTQPIGSVTDIPALLSAELATMKRKKATFSLRCYGIDPRRVRDLYRNCKTKLKAEGRPSRYVGTDRKPAQAVVLHEFGIIGDKLGCELLIIQSKDAPLWVGRTIGAQDIDAYTKRDVEKPVRDTTVGLLPPKLAQILLNLGSWAAEQAKPGKPVEVKKWKAPIIPVLDPFCGTGVIPLECLLRGWPVLASDLSQKAVNGCTKNIEWFRKEMKIAKKDVASTVWKQDASKPFALKEVPAVVVTETSLGPNTSDQPTIKDVSKWKTELEALEADFLTNVQQSLPGVPVVCTWPVWYHSKGRTQLEKVWEQLPKIGFKPVLPTKLATETTGRTSLLYRRPDQNVGREVIILLPTS